MVPNSITCRRHLTSFLQNIKKKSNYLEGEGLILELNWIPWPSWHGPKWWQDDLKSLADEVFDTYEARSPTEEATSTTEEATSKSGSSVLLFIFSAKDKTNKINQINIYKYWHSLEVDLVLGTTIKIVKSHGFTNFGKNIKINKTRS